MKTRPGYIGVGSWLPDGGGSVPRELALSAGLLLVSLLCAACALGAKRRWEPKAIAPVER